MGGHSFSPNKFMESQKQKWEKIWSPSLSKDELAAIAHNISTFRKHALENVDLTPHTPENYKKAIKNYGKDTQGVDMWKISDLKQLPDLLISNITDCCVKAVKHVALPHQTLISLNACLGKPSGDTRTVTKTPMLYRIMNKVMKPSITRWESQHNGTHNTCAKGISAIGAAAIRNLIAEIAHWLNFEVISAFNDLWKFYDSVDIASLLVEAVHTEYPPAELCLALQQHLAPRVIQCSGFSGEPFIINRSILAGCLQSIAMTKAMLYRSMHYLSKKHIHAPLKYM